MEQHNEKTVYINKEKLVCPKCGSDKKVYHDFTKQYLKDNDDVSDILVKVDLNVTKEDSSDGKEHKLNISFDVCAKCNTFYSWCIHMK